jgi:hypothetical protein
MRLKLRKGDCFTPSHIPSLAFAMTVCIRHCEQQALGFVGGAKQSTIVKLKLRKGDRLPTGQAGFAPFLFPAQALAMTVNLRHCEHRALCG